MLNRLKNPPSQFEQDHTPNDIEAISDFFLLLWIIIVFLGQNHLNDRTA